jgi:hypothetical protein
MCKVHYEKYKKAVSQNNFDKIPDKALAEQAMNALVNKP